MVGFLEMTKRSRRFFRPSKREEAASFNAAESFLAAGYDRDAAPREIKPKRVQAPRVDHADLEKHVLRAVGDLLKVHPKIFFAVRQNSGGMQYEGTDKRGNPETHSMWFYKIVRAQEDMTLSDYWGFLVTGKPFAFECKRPSWIKPHGEREMKQLCFLAMIRHQGGIGAFVTDAEQVNALLA